ncbi:MAG: ubiquinone/menaquinone biosynthesis methyltransferase [Bacteroidota bacterium]
MATDKKLAQAEMQAKGKPLQKMFNQVPGRYDYLNRVMTLGMDEMWRKRAISYIKASNPQRVMDLGTGTGDMALRMGKMLPETEITGYDFSAPMLAVAKNKAAERAVPNVAFVEGDAASMPFEDNFFDAIGISFAFRNMTFKNKNTSLYLQEALRVLKPGGQLVAVESSQPKSRFIRYFFHLYLKYIISGIGGRLAGAKGAYHYLAYSARHFYTTEELTALLQQHGFNEITHHQMFLGAAAITIAKKPED